MQTIKIEQWNVDKFIKVSSKDTDVLLVALRKRLGELGYGL